MSHQWDCPSEWSARRAGESDYERRGYRSYATPDDYSGCPEAERAYHDGQRSAMYRAEREEEDRQERERVARRQEMLHQQWAEEAAAEEYHRQMEEDYNQQITEEYEAAMREQWEALCEAVAAEVWGDGP